MTDAAAIPIPSATVLLLRDGISSLEVFMVLRNAGIDFAGGALVYPGGKSDPADLTEETAAYCDGVVGLDLVQIGNRVCGIRETFEEAGFLLAREKSSNTLVTGDRCLQLGVQYREAVHAGDLSMKDLAAQEKLTLACDLMVPFARWITPARSPKRFDTWFFLARAPEGQLGSHDQSESVDSLWISPGAALKGAADQTYNIVFATRCNLAKVGRRATVAEALETAQDEHIIPVEPEITILDDNRVSFKIPPDAGYGFDEEIETNGPTVVRRS
ncbi:MAG: hypothetical protein CBD27_02355 [Rhodospirillaceae bacterium TMED167]|nr:NUDIX hydrolase [Rhodospirillaceae bacterium]MDG2033358.1 NUDIX hydrolase [Rhodospirillales bacterium]OUW29933.1 MAG: hypothetical protein CBD27_02355 [Rhodospirillaceae bacterium TMED167]